MKLLVVAAWESELLRFRELTPSTVALDSVGIGLVDAAIGTTRCVMHHVPTHVILLGTCGHAPGSPLAIGDVVVASGVRLIDPAVAEGRAAMPYPSKDVP